MRISGIETFLGGADNVVALEALQGEQRILTGTLKDQDDNVIDITNYVVEQSTEFYLADVTTTSRSTSITNLTSTTPTNSAVASIAISNAAAGEFELTIPEDLYGDEISTDITTDVPMAVVYARYSDGTPGDAGVTSRVSRFVIIIRRSGF